MNRYGLALGVAMSTLAVATAAGQSFTPGNLVLLQVGDGSTAVTNAAQIVLLKEVTPTGGLVQTISMPATTAGVNRRLTQNGTATSEGFLTRSADKRYLFLVGYDAEPGSTNPATQSSATVNRVIGSVAVDGSIDTTTAVTDASSSNIRAAASTDGTHIWFAQAGTSTNAGVRHVTLGAPGNTSEPISATTGSATNVRCVDIFNGQLFVTGATTAGPLLGVGSLGSTPPPTTGPEPIVQLSGFPTTSGPSAYQFFFADGQTLYVADDRTLTATSGPGGIQKWTYDSISASWSLQYTLNSGLTTGLRSIAGRVDGGTVTIYALTAGSASAGSALVSITDSGATSEFVTIMPATANTWYKGIAFTPESTTPACYANCDGSTTNPVLNVADFSCFLSKFAAGDAYANCDASTTTPVLNVADFSCFLSKFAAGCR